jgi:hypothetical protein
MTIHARIFLMAGTLACATGLWAGHVGADDAVRLREVFVPGTQYHVRARVDLTGTLTLPEMKDKPKPKPISIRGDSALEYDERVLAVTEGGVTRTLRIWRRMDFRRTVAEQPQESTLRSAARRMVLLRQKNVEVPFSPDGPLTFSEIDQVRTDVFTPALSGLLPDGAVHIGDHWTAKTEAIQELTDLEKIDEGSVECQLDRVSDTGKGREARIAFTGTVRGVNEDGPNRQKLTGYLIFDLATNHLSYLSLNGVSMLLDPDGKEMGRVEGRFVLTRHANTTCPELTEAAVKGVVTEPNDDNTRLLYDNPGIGVRFLYPRRWRVMPSRGNAQVVLDGADGSGLLLTLDPVERSPTGGQFLSESRAWLEKQKAKILKVVPPSRLRETPALDHFTIQADMGGEFWMEYFVTRQAQGGATLAVRLLPRDLETTRKEAEYMARSIVITKTIEEPREAKKK